MESPCSVALGQKRMVSRTRKSIWSMSSGLLYTAVTLLIGLLSTPWLLRWLGSERFGTYRVLVDWMAHLALFDLGMGGAVIACLAQSIGTGDSSAVRSFLAAGLRMYSYIAAVMLLGGVGLVLGLPKLLSRGSLDPHEIQFSGLILLIPVLLTPFSVFRALAEARQQGYAVSLLLTLQSVLMTGLLLVTAWAGWGLAGQSISTTLAMLPFTVILVFLGVRIYPGVLSAQPREEALTAVWRLNWPTFVFNVCGRIGLLSDNILVGWAVGPAAVAPFYLTQRLASIAQAQLQGVGNATWAALVELWAQGECERFRSRLLELTGFISGIGVAVLGPIAAYNRHFVSRWLGAHAYAGDLVTVSACINVWLWSIYSLWSWPLSGTGNIGRWVPYAILFLTVNLIVSIFATFALGWIGPLLGTLLSFVLVNSWAMPRVLQQIFGLSPRLLWGTAMRPLLWGLPYTTLIWWLSRSHTPRGWPEVAAELVLTAFFGSALWWNLDLNANTRAVWRARIVSGVGFKD